MALMGSLLKRATASHFRIESSPMNTSKIDPTGNTIAEPSISFFELYLAVWIALGHLAARLPDLKEQATRS